MSVTQVLKRGDLREALIEYASAETDSGRIDSMSLRAAARDLGVSSGAVYRHFVDKEALLVEIVRRGFMEMRAVFHAIRPECEPATRADQAVARAYTMGHAYMGFAFQNPTLWRLMFGRIGVICRDQLMADDEMRSYTILDVAAENTRDLFRLSVLENEPGLQDIRFMWSALHGAADLAQSGQRLDGAEVDAIAEETVTRSLRALGCPARFLHARR